MRLLAVGRGARLARRVVEAFDQAEAASSAAIQVDGRLVDYPIAEKARWLLERAGATNR